MISKHQFIIGVSALVLGCGFFADNQAVAEETDRGEVIAYTCLGCHGIEGYRNAYPSYRVPKLGGQKEAYLVAALQGYKNGTREHTTMNAQAQSLSDEDINAVSAFLATLGTETVESGGSEAVNFEPAQTCVACHGPNGISVSPGWPTLAGQYEDYLAHALKQYRDGTRKDQVMGPLAANLDDKTIAQLAAYFSSLAGLETTKVEP